MSIKNYDLPEEPLFVFDDSVKDKLIKSLGFRLNMDGYLEDNNGKIIINMDFDPISIEEFGGLLKGSKLAIKKSENELAKYFLSLNK